jgi:hypothetical protein
MQINSTQHYYRYQPIDLLTEYTISETFSSINSPYMAALDSPGSYGSIVAAFLKENGLLKSKCRICEIGGGYGSLMKGFLETYSPLVEHVFMADISRFLLKKQKNALNKWASKVSFINGDAMEMLPLLSKNDLIILNEVIGDLETWEDLDASYLPDEVSSMVERYGLAIPESGSFSFNRDAVVLVEKICEMGMNAFLVEHSSDPIIPENMEFLGKGLQNFNFPRKIRLKGHSEFTIRFSHLINVAETWGRNVTSGSLIDLVGIKSSPKMRFIFLANACATDEQEIIYELLDHIREYRWLIIK